MDKLPRNLENPIDNVLLAWSARLGPPLRATGHTPNQITTYSLVAGVLAAAALHRGAVGWFSALYAAAYFLDCADGQYARRYGMVSVFGDWYDHVSDAVKLLCIGAAAAARYAVGPADCAVMGALLVATCTHMGCQQQYHQRHRGASGGGETLDGLQPLCPAHSAMLPRTRWFGMGTLHAAIVVWIWTLEYRRRRRTEAAR